MKLILFMPTISMMLAISACEGGGTTTLPSSAATPTPAPLSCPTNYVDVPADATLGTAEFCIATFEMRDVGGVATSQAANTPWVSITHDDALAKCTALGAHYDMISNAQWQAAARNIAGVAVNWSSGTVGTGYLNGGAVDPTGFGFGPCDSTIEYLDGSSCTNTTADFRFKRTNTLSNGSVVWDMGGNVYEMVKTLSTAGQYTGDYAHTAPATNPHGDALGTQLAAFGITPGAGWVVDTTYSHGLGMLVNGTNDNSVTNRVPLRGGSNYDYGGIFLGDIGWFDANTSTDSAVGFRCIYH